MSTLQRDELLEQIAAELRLIVQASDAAYAATAADLDKAVREAVYAFACGKARGIVDRLLTLIAERNK